MFLARCDNQLQGLFVDFALVLLETRAQALAPLVLGDRRQLVEAAELVERATLVAEHVAHQMLDASGEQAGDAR